MKNTNISGCQLKKSVRWCKRNAFGNRSWLGALKLSETCPEPEPEDGSMDWVTIASQRQMSALPIPMPGRAVPAGQRKQW